MVAKDHNRVGVVDTHTVVNVCNAHGVYSFSDGIDSYHVISESIPENMNVRFHAVGSSVHTGSHASVPSP